MSALFSWIAFSLSSFFLIYQLIRVAHRESPGIPFAFFSPSRDGRTKKPVSVRAVRFHPPLLHRAALEQLRDKAGDREGNIEAGSSPMARRVLGEEPAVALPDISFFDMSRSVLCLWPWRCVLRCSGLVPDSHASLPLCEANPSQPTRHGIYARLTLRGNVHLLRGPRFVTVETCARWSLCVRYNLVHWYTGYTRQMATQ